MIKRLLPVLLVLCLLALPGTAGAQDTSWRVAVFDPAAATITYLSPEGAEVGPAFPALLELGTINGARLSPDGRFLVASVYGSQSGAPEMLDVYVADVTTGACCTRLTDPGVQFNLHLIGPFSPDSRQIAVSMSDTANITQPVNAAIGVFDLETGSLVNSLPLSGLEGGDRGVVGMFGAWDENGIQVIPSCWGCEPPFEGLYQVWDPSSNAISAPGVPFNLFRDTLPGTGEQVEIVRDPAYPESGVPGGMFATANVVTYYTGGDQPEGQVIYFHSTNHIINGAYWVNGGNAVLIQLGGPITFDPDFLYPSAPPGDDAVLLFRDGRSSDVAVPYGRVLAGTPDGWVGLDFETNRITYYRVGESGDVTAADLTTIQQPLLLNTDFVLGEGAGGSFPSPTPPQATTCPGAAVSRLVPNSVARVTPGDPNNLRAEPSTSSTLLGEIPGEASVLVLDGPTCAENMAWWQVNYKGQIGWTPEGQGETYWLEPLALLY